MIDPQVLRRRLLAAISVTSVLGLAIEILHAEAPGTVVDALTPVLSLSYEGNVPTWFSSALLLSCALAAGSIAAARPPMHRHWWGMALVAGYMSLDETAELHEHLGGHLHTSGVLYFDWVIPAAAIVAVIGALYLPFVRALAEVTRRRLVIAAAIYIGGALVMELPLGAWTDAHGAETLGYGLIDWVEETMEMVGAALALVALVAHPKEPR
ncbi:MAG: hypothetical protein HOV81_04650 [Kofleriaceae bacterium]|nr:hypothetical protein [Kofleriaceae bacterium]